MSITLPEGAPAEVVTHALRRDLDLEPFGISGNLAIITLDNALDYTRPNTFGPESLIELRECISAAAADATVRGIAITGKPYILAAGADLSGVSFVSNKDQA